jgi:hypothetical protein
MQNDFNPFIYNNLEPRYTMFNVKTTSNIRSNLATLARIPTHHNEVYHDDFYSLSIPKAFNNASTQKVGGNKPTINKATTPPLPQV